MNPARELDHVRRVEAGLDRMDVVDVPLEAVADVIRDAAPFARGRLHDAVRRDPLNEVIAEILEEVGVAAVSESLDRSDDRGRVDAISPREGTGGEVEGLVRVFESGLNEPAPARVQPASRPPPNAARSKFVSA
jgi:hypothetical protein